MIIAMLIILFPLSVSANMAVPFSSMVFFPYFIFVIVIESVIFLTIKYFYKLDIKNLSLFLHILLANVITSLVGTIGLFAIFIPIELLHIPIDSDYFFTDSSTVGLREFAYIKEHIHKPLIGLFVLFILTTLIEWLFYRFVCFKKINSNLLLFITLIANIASYTFLSWVFLNIIYK